MASRKGEIENGKATAEEKKPEIKTQKPESKEQVPAAKPQTNNAPINKELQKELQKQQRRLQNLEQDIEKAIQEKTKLEQALGLPENYADKKKFVTIESDFKKSMQNLESLNKQYEQLFEKVMELEMQFAG